MALLIYWFVFQLSKNKILAIINSMLILGGYAIASPSLLFSINVYSRAMTPYIPLVITFLYLNFLLKVLRQKSWKYMVAAGIALGSLFYVYFYAWSFILALNGFLIFFCLIRKERSYIRYLLAVCGIGLLLGAYNVINILSARGGEFGAIAGNGVRVRPAARPRCARMRPAPNPASSRSTRCSKSIAPC